MRIKCFPITSALLTAALVASSFISNAFAKEVAIYRWVDKNNLVHFSQNLPKSDEYTELSTISSYKALSRPERKTLADEKAAGQANEKLEKDQVKIAAKNKATFDKNCKAARLNIKMLSSLADIHISVAEGDGSIGSRPLTTKEKAEKFTLSKKHEELYCKKELKLGPDKRY
ncbi:MAG: DUF4124 domain-containing protein [Colwellia sp.]|nr:DUF4124 domain-containing protein [Colwellia sp.]